RPSARALELVGRRMPCRELLTLRQRLPNALRWVPKDPLDAQHRSPSFLLHGGVGVGHGLTPSRRVGAPARRGCPPTGACRGGATGRALQAPAPAPRRGDVARPASTSR